MFVKLCLGISQNQTVTILLLCYFTDLKDFWRLQKHLRLSDLLCLIWDSVVSLCSPCGTCSSRSLSCHTVCTLFHPKLSSSFIPQPPFPPSMASSVSMPVHIPLSLKIKREGKGSKPNCPCQALSASKSKV